MPFDIKKRREELGLTLEEIGQFVGVGKGTVQKWESGFIKNMRRDKIVSLAQALQVSPLDFLDNDCISPLTAQKKVPLSEELKKIYYEFILSVFDTLPQEGTAVVLKDNYLVLTDAKN